MAVKRTVPLRAGLCAAATAGLLASASALAADSQLREKQPTRLAVHRIEDPAILRAAVPTGIGRMASSSASAEHSRPVFTTIEMRTDGTRIEGRGTPSTYVDIYAGGSFLASTAVDASGYWAADLKRFAAGDHEIEVHSTDATGRRRIIGEAIRIAVPEGYRGIAFQAPSSAALRAPREPVEESARDLRREAEELATAATEQFSEVLAGKPWDRLAQVDQSRSAEGTTQTANDAMDGTFSPVLDWLDRSARDYNDLIVRRLAGPDGNAEGRQEADQPGSPLGTLPPPVRARRDEPSTAREPSRPAQPRDDSQGTVIDSAWTWLTRTSRDYQNVIVERLANPSEVDRRVSLDEQTADGERRRALDESELARRADQERREAEARLRQRQAEAEQGRTDTELDARRAEEARRAEDLRRQIEAQRREDERRIVELQRSEDERRAREAEAIAQRERQARAAEDAIREAQVRREAERQAALAEAARRAEEDRLAEQRRIEEADQEARQAALDEQRRAREAAEAQRQQAREEARRLAEANREEQQRQIEEARRAREEARQAALDEARRRAQAAEEAARRRSEAAAQTRSPESSQPSQEEAIRRAIAEAVRRAEEKILAERSGRGTASDGAPLPVRPERSRELARVSEQVVATQPRRRALVDENVLAEAHRKARELLRYEARRVAMLREEQGNSAMDSRQRALELRRASNAPKVYPPGYRIEQGSATEGPVDPSRDEQRSNVKVGALSGIRRLERAVKSAAARCPRAGRPVKPPGRYVVDKGDTLWSIAARHYGDGSRYRIIVRANRKQISDADMIRPCQRLYVPKAR